MDDPKTTHFGFEQVSVDEKAGRVASVFDSVSERYDVMNDLMSFGMHRLWKRFAISVCGLRPGARVLDLAGGTGDMSALAYPVVGASGEIVLADINRAMLQRGRDRLMDKGMLPRVRCVQVDAEALPFPDEHFDCVMMAFGLRNVTEKQRALESIYRVLRRGGRAIVLEFSQVTLAPLRPVYDAYSFRLLPALGERIARDGASYQYLAESIRMHPDQGTLLEMFSEAGFERCKYFNLAAGIVAVHRGYRLR
jgi:demethylmenaquinone methyltransferase/2-methoxy-6-polyprenyl-1,4-benzoquinol methylase